MASNKEYILYYQGKVIGGIYADRLLVKPTKSAVSHMPEESCELPTPRKRKRTGGMRD